MRLRERARECHYHGPQKNPGENRSRSKTDYRKVHKMSILVVGTVAFDSIETPSGSAERILGGSASYFAMGASFFAPVRIVGVIGKDFPDEYLDLFRSRGIDLQGIKPELPESYRDAEYVFLGNIDPDMQLEVLRQIRCLRLVACDTMDHWINNSLEALRRVLGKIEMLVVNDSEARLLSGESNIVRAARAILRMGPKTVLIKRGEYGVLQFSDSSIFAVPAYPLEEVFDPTGAGDSFAGGLFGQLARSGDPADRGLRRAIVYGSVVASFTVEDFGVERLKEDLPAGGRR